MDALDKHTISSAPLKKFPPKMELPKTTLVNPCRVYCQSRLFFHKCSSTTYPPKWAGGRDGTESQR